MAFYHVIWHFKWHSPRNRADLHPDTVAQFRTSGENLIRSIGASHSDGSNYSAQCRGVQRGPPKRSGGASRCRFGILGSL